MNFTLYRINRQLDLLSTRADRLNPGPCRDSFGSAYQTAQRGPSSRLCKARETR